MFDWLVGLPTMWQIALPFSAMFFLVISTIWGNAAIKFGKKSIRFGKPRRSCTKCRQLIMVKTLKYKTDREIVRSAILRDQMNYAEMKIHEAYVLMCRSYRSTLMTFRKPTGTVNKDREQKEYLLFQEAINNSFTLAKNEIRRSFKENGFCSMSPVEYTQYCKDKATALVAIGYEYLISRYPFERMIVPLQDKYDQLNITDVEAIVFDTMNRAKEIFMNAEKKLEKIDDVYDTDMENISKNE